MFPIDKIAMDLDSVLVMLHKLSGIPTELPNEGAMTSTEGASYGAASPFHTEIRRTAQDLADIVAQTRSNLEKTHDKVKAAMEDMVETDASIAQAARLVEAQFEAVNSSDPAPAETPAHVPTKRVNPGLK
jgi:hypothetical protein